ncbi:hypothetical protein BDV12DRAFT_182175 [Aspergillus spectabilis]
MTANATDNIKRKLALVTGSSGRIGAACARRPAEQDVHLALTFSSNEQKIIDLASSLASFTTSRLRISTHRIELSIPDDIERLLKEVQAEHGTSVDILVSKARYGKRIQNTLYLTFHTYADISLEEFNRMISIINLTASFLLANGIFAGMEDQKWERIVFVSSIAAYGTGLNGYYGTDYAASKAGLIGLMKNLSSRGAEYNITVNDVAPAMAGSIEMLPDASSFPGLTEIANAVNVFV